MNIDLGDILGGVRDVVSTYRFVSRDEAPQSTNFTSRIGAMFDDDPNTTFVTPDGRAVVQVPTTSSKSKGCRRRRRRLLTRSDLGDIAALKGIVGQGKAFENILAQAMYRSR